MGVYRLSFFVLFLLLKGGAGGPGQASVDWVGTLDLKGIEKPTGMAMPFLNQSRDDRGRRFLASLGAEKAAVDVDKECGPAHALTLVHSMKTGGMSMIDYLRCRLNGSALVLNVMFSPPTGRLTGPSHACEPSVVSTHKRRWQHAKYANSDKCFVLRHPVERVWSFFHYVRRWFLPFKQKPLTYFLANGGLDPNSLNGFNDLNRSASACRLKPKRNCEYCEHCFYELHNGIVRQLSRTATNGLGPSGLNRTHLDEAVAALRGFSMVGNLTRVFNWVEAWPLWPERTRDNCRLRHRNRYAHKSPRITEKEAETIARANHLDMLLYHQVREQHMAGRWK